MADDTQPLVPPEKICFSFNVDHCGLLGNGNDSGFSGFQTSSTVDESDREVRLRMFNRNITLIFSQLYFLNVNKHNMFNILTVS